MKKIRHLIIIENKSIPVLHPCAKPLEILSRGKTEQYRLTTLSTVRLSLLRHMIRFKNGGHARF